LSQLGEPHTQNFEILKFLQTTQESKNLKIVFENFNNMLDGSKFGENCLLGSSIQIFFQIWKILNFFQENHEFSLKKGQKFV
jgi:hypothetical protein